jgi:hypothetical protein
VNQRTDNDEKCAFCCPNYNEQQNNNTPKSQIPPNGTSTRLKRNKKWGWSDNDGGEERKRWKKRQNILLHPSHDHITSRHYSFHHSRHRPKMRHSMKRNKTPLPTTRKHQKRTKEKAKQNISARCSLFSPLFMFFFFFLACFTWTCG